MRHYFIILSSLIALINAKLPPFIKPCDISSNELNKCIKDNIKSAKPHIVEGIPDMSIPSFKEIPIPYSTLDVPDFHFAVSNYVIGGIDVFEVQKVDADFKNNVIKVEAFFPLLIGNGLAEIKGNVFNMNFDSMGPIYANLSNIVMIYTLKISLVERDGIQYMVKDSHEITSKQNSGKFYVHIENLSIGNETATEIMNDALNVHNDQFLKILFPILVNSLSQLLDSLVSALFKHCSFNDFFPKYK
ncbi:PREDICTED: uncharacterized protein LOC108565832 [Nicrophorus vespilloides]|uniref:Uncharacterized protein LOC108565832 n=1 Tax=Nicrophorus vespilloides TaxID=110193 RepID=A0ABM1N2B7_NICVS|nr:PREDICTED: uncharacterized protein LOC108565832 [Nicrophorus vespilloides]